MSVQAGIWNFNGEPVDPKLLAFLSEAAEAQGPDGEFLHVEGSIAFLYRPFHTTAESRREQQPGFSRRGFILTWDGRLDNRELLIAELCGEVDASSTDVAIVAAAFDRWETGCFRRIVGEWAASVWHPGENALYLAKDYAGIRHLYYCLTENNVLWCSHLAPIVLKTGAPFRVNDEYIAGYLVIQPEAHLTPYSGIMAVPPGHFVAIRPKGTKACRYWWFDPGQRIKYKSDAEYEEHFRHVFRQAVRRRLRSDRPILAELSGGLDSSSIVCMADDIIGKCEVDTPRLDTLSAYDPHDPNGDERPYVSKVEERRGRMGFHLELNTDPISEDFEQFSILPGPLFNRPESEFGVADVMRAQGNRILLSGIGGDEFLGGVPDPRPQVADLMVELRPVALARALMSWSLATRKPWVHLLHRTAVWLLPRSIRSHLSSEAKIAPWINSKFARRHRLLSRKLGPSQTFGFWLPTRRETARTLGALTNQMARRLPVPGREVRYPFLDQTLVEFLISIPESQLLRPSERRSLMRRALVGILPPQILSRSTKGTSVRGYLADLESVWGDLENILDSPISAVFGYVNQRQFREALDQARMGSAVELVGLLHGLALELWLRGVVHRGLLIVPSNVATSLDTRRTWGQFRRNNGPLSRSL
jgi:asparagine synthase (glutamine-hydrolysing)